MWGIIGLIGKCFFELLANCRSVGCDDSKGVAKNVTMVCFDYTPGRQKIVPRNVM